MNKKMLTTILHSLLGTFGIIKKTKKLTIKPKLDFFHSGIQGAKKSSWEQTYAGIKRMPDVKNQGGRNDF